MAILDTRGARRAAAHPGAMTRWAVVLAGGDGTRLLELTRGIAGDDRPKQFCAVLGEETSGRISAARTACWPPAGRGPSAGRTRPPRWWRRPPGDARIGAWTGR